MTRGPDCGATYRLTGHYDFPMIPRVEVLVDYALGAARLPLVLTDGVVGVDAESQAFIDSVRSMHRLLREAAG